MEDSINREMQDAWTKGDYVHALEIAEEYLSKTNPHDCDAMLMKAYILSLPDTRFSDYYSAIGIAFFALELGRSELRRWLGVADVCNMCGLYGEAERCYRRALEMDPTNYNAIICLASNRRAPGTQITAEEAKFFLETAISSKPDEWNAYHHLAQLLRELGDKKKALELYESALVRVPDTEIEWVRHEIEKQIKILGNEIGG
jgi:tetratricopeptide (TPR) repeat protein